MSRAVAAAAPVAGQLAALDGMGCRFLQGWLLGRPVPARELPAALAGVEATVRRRPGRLIGATAAVPRRRTRSPHSETTKLTPRCPEAHSVRVPSASLLVDAAPAGVLVVA